MESGNARWFVTSCLVSTYSPRILRLSRSPPVFGVLIAWGLLGEPMSVQQALGALAVAAGILVVTAER